MTLGTREKLIEAALEVFAEHGYQNATIQEIITRAGTNIAAVNYHFGDKATLYTEVVSHAIRSCQYHQTPALEKVYSPQIALRKFIHWFIGQAVGVQQSPSMLDQIQMQELMHPSPVLDQVIDVLIWPTHNHLRQIVAAILPENSSEERIRHHCFSIIGQCSLYKLGQPIITRLYPDLSLNDEQYAERLVEHIYHTSLVALQTKGAPLK